MGRRAAPSNNGRRNDDAQTGLGSHSEAAWKAMTSVEADDSDRWNAVEEHLVRSNDQDAKRWKYFGK
ncbi:MAG: hypothetical protein HY925_03880 [Elusimicrobia bacterium]|nr:hypothetical protein [Elusimicrobiota bacterium]